MRDNHQGMPEIIDAFKKNNYYFGVIGIKINGIYKTFQFGISHKGYLALKRILQLRPFDTMPGLKYRYFYAKSYGKAMDGRDCEMSIRVELGKKGKEVEVLVPKELISNLIWFSELKSFNEAAHLTELK